MDIINKRDLNKPEAYRVWADLRDMLLDLVSIDTCCSTW